MIIYRADDTICIGRECPFCGEYHEIFVSETDYAAWKGGELTISGICPICGVDVFSEDEY